MANDRISRVEEFTMRAMWLLLQAQVQRGGVSQKDFGEWVRDYYNSGGRTITPRVEVQR